MKCKMWRRSDGVMSQRTTIGLAAGLVHAGPVVARLKSDLHSSIVEFCIRSSNLQPEQRKEKIGDLLAMLPFLTRTKCP